MCTYRPSLSFNIEISRNKVNILESVFKNKIKIIDISFTKKFCLNTIFKFLHFFCIKGYFKGKINIKIISKFNLNSTEKEI